MRLYAQGAWRCPMSLYESLRFAWASLYPGCSFRAFCQYSRACFSCPKRRAATPAKWYSRGVISGESSTPACSAPLKASKTPWSSPRKLSASAFLTQQSFVLEAAVFSCSDNCSASSIWPFKQRKRVRLERPWTLLGLRSRTRWAVAIAFSKSLSKK